MSCLKKLKIKKAFSKFIPLLTITAFFLVALSVSDNVAKAAKLSDGTWSQGGSPGTTTITVTSAGTYEINYGISITSGVGSQIAIAVNGTVDASTPITALTATGELFGSAILTLAAGDVITLRNNSATPLTMTLAPGVGSQLTIKKLD